MGRQGEREEREETVRKEDEGVKEGKKGRERETREGMGYESKVGEGVDKCF